MQVAVEDQHANIVTSNTSTLTVTVTSGSFVAGSTTAVAAVNGIATFSNLILAKGTYTLKVSDGSLTAATSGSILVHA